MKLIFGTLVAAGIVAISNTQGVPAMKEYDAAMQNACIDACRNVGYSSAYASRNECVWKCPSRAGPKTAGTAGLQHCLQTYSGYPYTDNSTMHHLANENCLAHNSPGINFDAAMLCSGYDTEYSGHYADLMRALKCIAHWGPLPKTGSSSKHT